MRDMRAEAHVYPQSPAAAFACVRVPMRPAVFARCCVRQYACCCAVARRVCLLSLETRTFDVTSDAYVSRAWPKTEYRAAGMYSMFTCALLRHMHLMAYTSAAMAVPPAPVDDEYARRDACAAMFARVRRARLVFVTAACRADSMAAAAFGGQYGIGYYGRSARAASAAARAYDALCAHAHALAVLWVRLGARLHLRSDLRMFAQALAMNGRRDVHADSDSDAMTRGAAESEAQGQDESEVQGQAESEVQGDVQGALQGTADIRTYDVRARDEERFLRAHDQDAGAAESKGDPAPPSHSHFDNATGRGGGAGPQSPPGQLPQCRLATAAALRAAISAASVATREAAACLVAQSARAIGSGSGTRTCRGNGACSHAFAADDVVVRCLSAAADRLEATCLILPTVCHPTTSTTTITTTPVVHNGVPCTHQKQTLEGQRL